MSQGKYKLQVVLDLRERKKREAEKYLAMRRALLEEAEDELARRRRSVTEMRERQKALETKMLEDLSKGTQAHQVVLCRTQLKDLRLQEEELEEKVRQQQTVVARAEQELEHARELLIAASKELQALEKHREGWQQQVLREERRREQKINDEIGAVMYERQREDAKDG
jgi:flagellar export protein FliJ